MTVINSNQIKGITSYFTYEDGSLSECRIDEHNVIATKYGNFVPQYKRLDIRKKDGKSLAFHNNGNIRSISLEEQTQVCTPIGNFPAELITFFEDGSLDSLFPLNGQISFSWSEQEEGSLSQIFHLHFSFGDFTTKIIGLRFYPTGMVRSLILWPGEIIKIETKYGVIPVRIGFKLHTNGYLESIEPAEPTIIKTTIGEIKAYDPLAYGIDADNNSLHFNQDGTIHSLITSGKVLVKNKETNSVKQILSKLRAGLTEEDRYLTPIKLTFESNLIIIEEGVERVEFILSTHEFLFSYDDRFVPNICYGDCSLCSENC